MGSGPSDFAVAWDGSAFYFANAGINAQGKQQIKVFNRQGQLTRALMSNLRKLDRLTVTPSGIVYLMTLQRSGAVFEVFNAQGQPQPEQASTLELAVRNLELYPNFFTTDAVGNLYTGVILANEPQIKVLRISAVGQTQILPRGAIDRQSGFIWHEELAQPAQLVTQEVYGADGDLYRRSEEPAFAPLDVIVYDGNGQEVRRFRLPAGGINQVEQSLCVGLEASKVDGGGRIYIVEEPRRLDWVKVENTFEVLKYYVVMGYDGQGNRIGVRAVYNKPRYGRGQLRQIWDVDQTGNIYYLEFKPDHLNVMMAPVP